MPYRQLAHCSCKQRPQTHRGPPDDRSCKCSVEKHEFSAYLDCGAIPPLLFLGARRCPPPCKKQKRRYSAAVQRASDGWFSTQQVASRIATGVAAVRLATPLSRHLQSRGRLHLKRHLLAVAFDRNRR